MFFLWTILFKEIHACPITSFENKTASASGATCLSVSGIKKDIVISKKPDKNRIVRYVPSTKEHEQIKFNAIHKLKTR
jgi:hypothetical protein